MVFESATGADTSSALQGSMSSSSSSVWGTRYDGSPFRGGRFWPNGCCFEPFDENDDWQDLKRVIDSNDPFLVRRVLAESLGRTPAYQILMFAVRRDDRTASGEIVQLLLDAGACNDAHMLEHARETAVGQYEHDKCQDWNKSDESYDGGKHSHAPWELENYFIEAVLKAHRNRCVAHAACRAQRQGFLRHCIALAAFNWPVLVVMAVVKRLPTSFAGVPKHHRWLIAHTVQRWHLDGRPNFPLQPN
jgi:hypothetical protein